MAGDLTKRISTILTLKDDGFTKGLSEANKQIKLTESQLKLLGSGSKSAGNDIQGLTDKKKLLAQQISNVENKLKTYSDNITKNTNSLNKNIIENKIYYLILNNNSLYSNLILISLIFNHIATSKVKLGTQFLN